MSLCSSVASEQPPPGSFHEFHQAALGGVMLGAGAYMRRRRCEQKLQVVAKEHL